MKYYKDTSNQIYAFEDIVKQDFLNNKIKESSLTPITENEKIEIQKQKQIEFKQSKEYLEKLSNSVRSERDTLMEIAQNRVDRYNREVAMGLKTSETSETLQLIFQYMQDLADIPNQTGFPKIVEWPQEI